MIDIGKDQIDLLLVHLRLRIGLLWFRLWILILIHHVPNAFGGWRYSLRFFNRFNLGLCFKL